MAGGEDPVQPVDFARQRDELVEALAPLLDIIATTAFGDRPDVVAAVAVIDAALRKAKRPPTAEEADKERTAQRLAEMDAYTR